MLNGAQNLNFKPIIELLTIDLANAPGAPSTWTTTLRYSSSNVSFNVGVTWQGQYYEPANFRISGINEQAGGQIPEPTLEILAAAPVAGNLMDFMTKRYNASGAKVTRVIMAADHRDGGANPSTAANDRIEQVFYIGQSETLGHNIQFKLSTTRGLDSTNDKVNRPLSTTQCNKKYRVWNIVDNSFKYTSVEDGGCEYGQASEATYFPYVPAENWGTKFFDANNVATTDPTKDRCSKSVTGCHCRFNWTPGSSDVIPISINYKGTA